ncbi:hypothetical protein PL2TA16_01158 [Pseudoalteromonas luteoviolacea 2ta16]|uniref:Uncharacterized protein n=1 Tax=Pseudoalteromonas luteoviolacea (strain 2ta16) TaxID=1353533 RepID=V4H125_PSEL2|nr:hypothetical protein PL2TA16_01158 [Pseudoalteromonas luteoviolacea 2ta16]
MRLLYFPIDYFAGELVVRLYMYTSLEDCESAVAECFSTKKW